MVTPSTHDAPRDHVPVRAGDAGRDVDRAWDWFAAERIAVAVAGGANTDLDDAHAILIHLHEKVPGSSATGLAIARGVPPDRLWSDDRFLASVWTMAANKLTDLRRAVTRRRAPRFRRPNGTGGDLDEWRRYPPHFRIVSANWAAWTGIDAPGSEVADDGPSPGTLVEGAEMVSISRQVVKGAIRGLRAPDVEVLDFAYARYSPILHGHRVDEALAAHLSATGSRNVTRDAARRRLTDARIRLEDAIVGTHRHALLHALRDGAEAPSSPHERAARSPQATSTNGGALRTALLAYLSLVGRRPREVVIDTVHATLIASTPPDGLPWPDRASLAGDLKAGLRALFVRHEAWSGAPFFAGVPRYPEPAVPVGGLGPTPVDVPGAGGAYRPGRVRRATAGVSWT